MDTENKTTNAPQGANDELIIASRVKDTPVFNSFGDKVGHIEELSIEKRSGTIKYALMSFGGFLGIGEKLHPLPWSILKYDSARDGYTLALTKEQLSGAPSYTAEELSAYGGRDVEYRDPVRLFYAAYVAPI